MIHATLCYLKYLKEALICDISPRMIFFFSFMIFTESGAVLGVLPYVFSPISVAANSQVRGIKKKVVQVDFICSVFAFREWQTNTVQIYRPPYVIRPPNIQLYQVAIGVINIVVNLRHSVISLRIFLLYNNP